MDPIKPHETPIQPNEVLLKASEQWLHFSQPYRIIQVNALQDIIPALHELEDLIETRQWHAAGFIAYEAASAFDPAHLTQPGTECPLLWFGLYPAPRLATLPRPAQPKEILSWLPTVNRDTYKAAIEKIKSSIADGRTYQVNYTMRLQAAFKDEPWQFFLHLAQTQNNHAAYLDIGRYVICSASPELFFQLDGDHIICRPMKGTAARGRTTLEDQQQAQWLKDSDKNRAENVMIVDMIRNDLGRIARIGSVHVPELFAIEKYPTLWQMTSTVTAKTDGSITKIFGALFPCASITGAPKVSTMRIISQLEATPRNIYTGSIGYISPDRKASFNVAIRTALIDRKKQIAEYGVGGGIVWDSSSSDEYEEAVLKSRVLTEHVPEFSLLETMLWTPEAGFFLRDRHVARLLDSADYFGFPVSVEKIDMFLDQLAAGFHNSQRARLLLDRSGIIRSEHVPFEPTNGSLRIRVAARPVHSDDIFLFHKTTHRAVYENARTHYCDCDDVLLYNQDAELTEFTIGNLVVELNGQLFTPPISCGVLPGVFRAHLLESGQVSERVIRVDELRDCTKVFLVNSVRKWQTVHLIE